MLAYRRLFSTRERDENLRGSRSQRQGCEHPTADPRSSSFERHLNQVFIYPFSDTLWNSAFSRSRAFG